MPNLSSILIAASALIVFALGTLHLLFTYRGNAFEPRDAALLDAMKAVSPRVSRETTIWRAGIGFHASHSLGAMLFGLVYAYLALEGSGFLFRSVFLMALGLVALCAYLALAKLYWFRIPLRGLALATGLYAAALMAHFA
jgi:hypothetical protein